MGKTPARERIPSSPATEHKRLPPWRRLLKFHNNQAYREVSALLDNQSLHTVCQEALCPNRGECWGAGTATFLLLGDVCTRACKFCDVKHGQPGSPGLGRTREGCPIRSGYEAGTRSGDQRQPR